MSTIVLVIASVILFQPGGQHQSPPNERLAEIVDSLGYPGRNHGEDGLKILARSSPDTVFPMLIAQLSLITDATEMSEFDLDSLRRDSHIIWCIRALDYLTDTTMTALTTTYRFGKRAHLRRYFVSSVRAEGFRFFGEWMSRAWIFIAPIDVQRAIIKGWKHWYLSNKAHLQYHLDPDENDWYWG